MTTRSTSHDPDELMTVSQVAAHFQVSVRTVHRYIATGQIAKTILPGGQARIRRADVDAALSRPASA